MFDEKKIYAKNDYVTKLLKIVKDFPKEFKENISEVSWIYNYFAVYLKNGITLYCHPENFLGKIDMLPMLYSELNYKPEDIEYFDLRFKEIYFMPKKDKKSIKKTIEKI